MQGCWFGEESEASVYFKGGTLNFSAEGIKWYKPNSYKPTPQGIQKQCHHNLVVIYLSLRRI